jgi:hypothetical protein
MGKTYENALMKLLKAFPDKDWNYRDVATNENMTVRFIIENKQLQSKCDWVYVSRNLDVTIRTMQDNLKYKINWSYRDLAKNPNFSSKIEVQKDASLIVTEKISVFANNQEINHGIYRDFPTIYKDTYGNKYKVDFNVILQSRTFVLQSRIYLSSLTI